MSLINEALKKAQRQRTDQPDSPAGSAVVTGTATTPPDAAASEMPVRRGRSSRSGAPVVLLGAGGAVLVVISVVVTVFLLNRPAPRPAGASPRSPGVNEVASSPAPVASLPEIKAPVIPRLEPATTPVETAPAPSASPANTAAVTATANPAPEPATATATESASTAAPVASAAAAPATPRTDGKTDPRISAFVDAIRVAGIRSSGNESRVLMNEKVYRVNDLVERTLAIRLTKVEADTLTFTDANGIVYVKSF